MSFKQIANRIWVYVKYPIKFKMDSQKFLNQGKYNRLGLFGFPPNYFFLPHFNPNSVVVDVGCGFEAELSVTLIEKFGLKSFAIDPTHKHAPLLQKIEAEHVPNLTYWQYALSSENGETVFYEAEHCESGSLLTSHTNVQNDTVQAYQVKLIDLQTLIGMTKAVTIDLLKIDIEGAEYSLFNKTNLDALKHVKQLFVEFHHISVKDYNANDTKNIVKIIENQNFNSFSYDGLNYLFYRNQNIQ
ncbi:MAG: hypothetical protein AUK44_03865 [Porphyromonadaceae bacterium CG2_30_38_12]|nr:MAG: hypothetical protein AUK44_03865 [Porphyromonadaceae bacterium CG2_30_38_12]